MLLKSLKFWISWKYFDLKHNEEKNNFGISFKYMILKFHKSKFNNFIKTQDYKCHKFWSKKYH